MGWASGSRLAMAVWAATSPHIPIGKQQASAEAICAAFEREDCDTLQEAADLWAARRPWLLVELTPDGESDEILDDFATWQEAHEARSERMREEAKSNDYPRLEVQPARETPPSQQDAAGGTP